MLNTYQMSLLSDLPLTSPKIPYDMSTGTQVGRTLWPVASSSGEYHLMFWRQDCEHKWYSLGPSLLLLTFQMGYVQIPPGYEQLLGILWRPPCF